MKKTMANTEVEYDESYVAQRGHKLSEGGEYPFQRGDRGSVAIRCQHGDFFTACVEEHRGERYAVLAMATLDGGLLTTFTADELRTFAKQMGAMAEAIERGW